MEKEAQTVLSSFKAASALLTEKEEEMKTVKKQHDEIKARVAKLQSLDVDAEHAFEELDRAYIDVQAKVTGWEKKLQGLKLNKVFVLMV